MGYRTTEHPSLRNKPKYHGLVQNKQSRFCQYLKPEVRFDLIFLRWNYVSLLVLVHAVNQMFKTIKCFQIQKMKFANKDTLWPSYPLEMRNKLFFLVFLHFWWFFTDSILSCPREKITEIKDFIQNLCIVTLKPL